jgi:hypothetical protein
MNSSNQDKAMITRNPALCIRKTVEIGTRFCTLLRMAYRVPINSRRGLSGAVQALSQVLPWFEAICWL